MTNPLLDYTGLPDYAAIRAEHVVPAITQILQQNRRQLAELLAIDDLPDWDNFMLPLEMMDDRLSRSWSQVSHLNAVVNSPALRDAYNACLPLVSDYATELGQNQALYQRMLVLQRRSDELQLDAAQRKVLDDALLSFKLSGVTLDAEHQQQFKTLQQKLSAAQSRFEENLIDCAAAWHLKTGDETRIAMIPDDAQARGAATAREHGSDGWWFSLDYPHYHAIVTYCDDRELRRAMYEAWVTRGSDQGPHDIAHDNSAVMREILALRRQEATLLGYRNFAEVSLAAKMAESPEQVIAFLEKLLARVKPQAEQEFRELQQFAAENFSMTDIAAWDVAWLGEKLRKRAFDISQQELRPYFPLPRVLDGLFMLVERLYGIKASEQPKPSCWHDDVRFYAIHDAAGTLRGEIYMDFHARPRKRGGAWMDEVHNRFLKQEGLQTPIAQLVCNFAPPSGDIPCLLTHDDVQTLFHEFGHCLHHLLTQVAYPSVAGINGVAWDAVELPSQFHENFAWDRDVLGFISEHYRSGERLPDNLFEKMTAARHFHAGLFLARQLEFALFDMQLHRAQEPDIEQVLQAVRRQVSVVPVAPFNRFAHSFSHIFAGGYAAGYYSYLWAEVMSSDAYAAFEENGLLDRKTGERFMHAILEKGGSAPPAELFFEFRGRAANEQAFMRHHGIGS